MKSKPKTKEIIIFRLIKKIEVSFKTEKKEGGED
jgi:hypothetical protein